MYKQFSYLLGNVLELQLQGTILNYKRDPYIHLKWSLGKPKLDSSSCERLGGQGVGLATSPFADDRQLGQKDVVSRIVIGISWVIILHAL